METRECRLCKTEKPLDSFDTYQGKGQRAHITYRRWQCKRCRNAKTTAWTYKISYEEVMALRESENCEICNIDLEWSDRYIDHNHDTGKVRGILCPRCNSVLSTVENNIGIIDKMKNYLKQYE